jgi:hypothetical protein
LTLTYRPFLSLSLPFPPQSIFIPVSRLFPGFSIPFSALHYPAVPSPPPSSTSTHTMSLDNSPKVSSILKTTDAFPSQLQCRRTRTIPDVSPTTLQHSKQSCSMPCFVPRPFPPPSLVHVPVEYIIDQLHYLAPHYWNRPETTDCTIIVPVPQHRGKSMRVQDTSFPPETVPSVASRHDPAGLGRRVTEPTIHSTPRISLNLHIDYLSAQSTFLRGLFSGASPLDLINTTSKTTSQSRSSQTRFTVPANRLPRLLPSSPGHPILLLPVPDPASFHLLVHWIYFGRTDFIEDCLNRGVIQWEGIARNVEYLGFPTDIKIFLGRWYGDWLRSRQTTYGTGNKRTRTAAPRNNKNNKNNDSMAIDSDDDGMDEDFEDNNNSYRGRPKATRPLSSSHRFHSK